MDIHLMKKIHFERRDHFGFTTKGQAVLLVRFCVRVFCGLMIIMCQVLVFPLSPQADNNLKYATTDTYENLSYLHLWYCYLIHFI
jgi:hypothetical protein